jgi:hypothetical protein
MQMIHRLYNPWHIFNSGEKETDKQLSDCEDRDELYWVIHQMRLSSRFMTSKMAGECDFVVLTRPGIMIIEVKGGMIGHGTQPEGGTGYYRLVTSRTRESVNNPFIQAYGNADAVRKYLLEKGLKNIFVGSMACFPECEFEITGIGEGDLWHRGHKVSLGELIIDALERQIEKFRVNEVRKGATRYIEWKELDEKDMATVCKALEPEYDPALSRSLLRLNLEEADRRMKEGLSVLSGLNENKRIIVQGPPGSGKSTYAFDIISRLCKKEGKKGLYLCWTELLCAEMKARVSDPLFDIPPGRIKVQLYFDLATELAVLSGDKSLIPTKDTVRRGELRTSIKGSVAKLGNSKKIEKYDFLVIDEAQDIFDKGVDHIVKVLLKVNNPLQNGNYYIFYDDSQDYPEAGDLSHYIRTRDLFKSGAASYNLVSSLRQNTGQGISELIADAASGVFDPVRIYGNDVVRREWRNPEEAVRLISQSVLQETAANGIAPGKIMVLCTAGLMKPESPLKEIIGQDERFELLTSDNYSLPTKKIRYTTMLKSKGLERDVVVLVCSHLSDKKSIFQLFIGASRAKCRVYLITEASGVRHQAAG